MEVVAAIGLICNVVQLLDYGRKLLRELQQMRNITSSDLGTHEARLRALMHVVKNMEATQTPHRTGTVDSDDGHLKALCNLAQTKAAELADILAMIRPPNGCSTARQVKIAVLSVSHQAKIKDLSKDLADLYAEALAFYHMQISQANAAQLARQSGQMSDLVNVAEQNRLIAEKSQQIVESTREDIQILVRKIDQLPKVFGQEWEHDPVVYVDDGLTAPFPLPIRFCHKKTGFITVLTSMFTSHNLPGGRQFESKHVEILDAAFNAVNEEDWAVSVRPGRKLFLSFVMGTLWGFPTSKCPRCRKAYKGGTRPSQWRRCTSCKLELKLALPDDYDYEPQDVVFVYENVYRDHKVEQQKQGVPKDPELVPLLARKTDATPQPAYAHVPHPQNQKTKTDESPSVDLVCRRITLKWEPMFNIVHRYLLCSAVCPRHNDKGISYRDYGELVNNHEDPYFKPFGGYDCFRAALASNPQIYKQLGGEAFITSDEWRRGIDKLQWMMSTYPEQFRDVWVAYSDNVRRIVTQERPKRSLIGIKFNLTSDFEDCPMMREVYRILEGKWDGRPHWAWDASD